MKKPPEPPVTITITDEKSLLKALLTCLNLMDQAFARAHEEAQARKIGEN